MKVNLSQLAPDYNKKRPLISLVRQELSEIFLSLFPSTDPYTFLDVGCGAGQISEFVLMCLDKSQVVGVDITDEMLLQCTHLKRIFGNRCNFLKLDINTQISQLQLASDSTFDCMILSQSLHFISPGSLNVLLENHISKHGCVLIIATLPEDLEEIPYCWISDKVLSIERKRLIDLKAMTNLFSDHNFELIYNKRKVLVQPVEDIRQYFLSRPFSALTILDETELSEGITKIEKRFFETNIIDIFNVIVFRRR